MQQNFFTATEFDGLSVTINKNGIVHSELKILAKIQLGVICGHIVDFCRPSHINNVTVCYNENRQIPTYVHSSNHTCVFCMSTCGIAFCSVFDTRATCESC